MGSRAVALVCRDAEAARERFGAGASRRARPDGPPAPCTPVPAARSSTTPPVTEEILGRLRTAVDGGRPVGGTGHRLAAARRRADAVVAEGVRACCAPSTRRWAPRRGAVFPGAVAALEAAAAGAWTSAALLARPA